MSDNLINSISIEEERERKSYWLNVSHHATSLEQANDLWQMDIDTSNYSQEQKEDIAVSFGKFRTPYLSIKTLEHLRDKVEDLDLIKMLYRAVLITIPSTEYDLHSKEELRSKKKL
jgi:hypothetical protein